MGLLDGDLNSVAVALDITQRQRHASDVRDIGGFRYRCRDADVGLVAWTIRHEGVPEAILAGEVELLAAKADEMRVTVASDCLWG